MTRGSMMVGCQKMFTDATASIGIRLRIALACAIYRYKFLASINPSQHFLIFAKASERSSPVRGAGYKPQIPTTGSQRAEKLLCTHVSEDGSILIGRTRNKLEV